MAINVTIQFWRPFMPRLLALWRYRGFVFTMVWREFWGRYLGSLLGSIWSIINPMAMIFFLPSYSPELNPTEQVWKNVKGHNVGRRSIFGHDQMKSIVISQLRKIQKLPKIIIAFFKHPDCAYAID